MSNLLLLAFVEFVKMFGVDKHYNTSKVIQYFCHNISIDFVGTVFIKEAFTKDIHPNVHILLFSGLPSKHLSLTFEEASVFILSI